MKATLRKTWLVNRPFQLRMIGFTLGVSGLVTIIYYTALQYFLSTMEELGQRMGFAPDHNYFYLLNEHRVTMDTIFAFVSMVSTACIVGLGLVLSHRIAGPLYRLHRHMTKVAEGRTRKEVRFREKDLFPELSIAYNRQLAKLRGLPVPKVEKVSKAPKKNAA